MLPIVATLASAGLTLLAEAIKRKGKDLVEKKLGVKIPDDPQELTPDKIEELHRLEVEHETVLLSLIESGFESLERYKEVEVFDRVNAREQETKIATSKDVPLLLKYFKPILAFLLTVLTFGLAYILFFVDLPDDKRDIINFVFGNVFGYFGAMVTYYFGSSESSGYKNQLFEMLLKTRKFDNEKVIER